MTDNAGKREGEEVRSGECAVETRVSVVIKGEAENILVFLSTSNSLHSLVHSVACSPAAAAAASS